MIAGSYIVFSKTVDIIVQSGYHIDDYDNDQLIQIAIGIKQGLDILSFIDPDLNYEEILRIRMRLILSKIKNIFRYKKSLKDDILEFEKRAMDNHLIYFHELSRREEWI